MAVEDMYKYLDELAEELNILDQEEMLEMLIELGKELEPIDEEFKIGENRVPGCISDVWIIAKLADDEIHYFGDGSSMVIKGYITILINALSGLKIDEILNIDSKIKTFIENTNINSSMTASRADSFSNIFYFMKDLALKLKINE